MNVLVDTSVWIDHFHGATDELSRRLAEGNVCTHSFVIGELACGSLARRSEVLELLQKLPRLSDASFEETFELIQNRKLWGQGLGWADAQLLASCLLEDAYLWTRDKALKAASLRLGVALLEED